MGDSVVSKAWATGCRSGGVKKVTDAGVKRRVVDLLRVGMTNWQNGAVTNRIERVKPILEGHLTGGPGEAAGNRQAVETAGSASV